MLTNRPRLLTIQLGETTGATACLTDGQPLRQPIGVSFEPIIRVQTRLEIGKESIYKRSLTWLDGVVNPLTVLAGGDESGLTNYLQMSRKRGLTHLHRIRQFTDTQLAAPQRGHHTNACRVSKRFGKQTQIMHSCIVKSGYNDMFTRSSARVKPKVVQ